MTRDLTLPKSAPVHSPLAESTKQLRIPQMRSPPQVKRFAHLPELHTKAKELRVKSAPPGESPFKDKKRLVDQFYELATPGPMTPKAASGATPTISRSNTVEDLTAAVGKFQFLKDAPRILDPLTLDENVKSVMKTTVGRMESEVLSTVKHRNQESELEMSNTRTHFEAMENEIVQMKNKLRLYISLLEDKAKSVEDGYEKLEGEIEKLYKTLSTLDQYEIVVETSRAKMLGSKKKLHDLTTMVEDVEVRNVENKEKLKVTKKWIKMCLCGLVLMYLFKCVVW